MLQKSLNRCFFVLTAVVITLFLQGIAFAEEREAQVFSDQVNMREEPNTDAAVVTNLPIGQVVKIIEEVNDWSLVEYDGMRGYIRSDLLFVRSSKGRLAYALKDGVYLRGAPGTSSYVITETEVGTPMTIKQIIGEWYYVEYKGEIGFVQKDLISVTSKEGQDAGIILKFGMEGAEVAKIQKELTRRGFLKEENATGTYGTLTRNAVKEFQELAKMESSDGIAGEQTLSILFDKSNDIKKAPKIPKKNDDFFGRVQMIDWLKGGNRLLKRPGGVANVYDIASGKTFKIRRVGGNKHNDCVPYSAKDTAVMKSAYHGRWTHDRRAVLVIVGSKVYAASMYGMPHGSDKQKNDNYPGVLCIHFKNSKTHGGNNLDPGHQSQIKYAYSKYNK